MNRDELMAEIDRVQKSIKNASSLFIVRDFSKYLAKLKKRLKTLEQDK